MDGIVTEFSSAAVSDRGLNEGRPQNEDSFLELPEHGIFAVADGVGGAQAGEVASQMAVEILGEAFVNMGPNADPEDTMRVALERANEAIFQMSRDIAQLTSMATTVVAVHISGDMATIAHVGDSRVYKVDAAGRLSRETDDHSVVEEEVRAGRMTPEQALNHPSRNVISRALGAEETVLPDLKCVLIHPGTTFLLCSDGITRHIGDDEIEQLLGSEFGPEDICARMKEICFSRGAEDNLTAVIVRFPGDGSINPLLLDETLDDDEPTIAGPRDEVPADTETTENIEFPPENIPAAASASLPPEAIVTNEAFDDLVDEEPYLLEEEPATSFGDETVPDEKVSGPIESDHEERTSEPAPVPAVLSYASVPSTANADPSTRPPFPILILLIGLAVGAALGAVAGYYMLRSSLRPTVTVDPPVIVEQKSNNIPLTAFEETRRTVDADPVKYLNANAASPQEAGDFFWLGRALLLTNKPVEARRAYEQARVLLLNVQEKDNIKTMSNEIMMALAIIDSFEARELLKKQIDAANLAAQSNTNANVAVNASPIVR